MQRRTEIVVLLDRSGSMQTGREDHEGGLNSFVADQQKEPGDARFTFIQFDSNNPCEIIYDGTPLSEVGSLSLVPRGGTPLYRAILQAGAHVKVRLDKDPAEKQVIFLIITDGQDTDGGRFEANAATARAFIGDREKEGWTFLYLGANVDAFSEGSALGIGQGTTMNFMPEGVGNQSMYAASSANLRSARRSYAGGASLTASVAHLTYNDDQRAAAAGDEETTGTTTLAGAVPAVMSTSKKNRSVR